MTVIKSLHHVGIAVHSLEDARSFYEGTLGAVFEGVEEIASQQVRVVFLRVGDVRLELLEPTNSTGPVAKFLEKRGEGLHHLAFAVDGLQSRIDELKISGLQMIDDQPRAGAHGMPIAFMHPKSANGVLTELCEPSQPATEC